MNTRKPPQDDKYKMAIIMDNIWKIAFFISIGVTFFQSIKASNEGYLLLKINAAALVSLFVLENLRRNYISEATTIRRKNLFDTTFNLNRIENRVDEFYNNHEIDDNMIELFANIQESMLYTKEISLIMLKQQYKVVILIGILALVSIFNSGITEYNFITMGILLSHFGLGRALDIRSVHNESNKLFEESLRIINDIDSNISECNRAEMLELIINYESILSSMNFVLSGEIHNKNEVLLSEKWTKLKKKYNIYK